jgi:hypothetical protein
MNKLFLLYFISMISSNLQSTKEFRYRHFREGDVSAHILTTTKKANVTLELGIGSNISDREDAVSIARRTGAKAVINGSFFKRGGKFNGYPENTLKIDSHILVSTMFNRGCFGFGHGHGSFIDKLQPSCIIQLNEQIIKIDRINIPQNGDETIIFTRAFGERTKSYFPGYIELIARCYRKERGGVSCFKIIGANKNQNSYIQPGEIIISLPHTDSIEELLTNPNNQEPLGIIHVNIYHSYMTSNDEELTQYWNNIPNIIEGTPSLVINQTETTAAEMAEELMSGVPLDTVHANFHDPIQRNWLINEKHPRTAVGYNRFNQMIFVVVDGRQPNIPGMTLPELATFMKNLDCIGAINLGGGGDSVMVVNGEVKNIPSGPPSISEGRPELRPISNAFCIF